MKLAAVMGLLGMTVVACTASDAPSSASASVPSPKPSVTTLTTHPIPSVSPEEPEIRTRLRLVDAATLQPTGPAVVLPGQLLPGHGVLPDGRLALYTFDEGSVRPRTWVALLDPVQGDLHIAETPLSSGAEILGYSATLEQVVLQSYGGSSSSLVLFDPASMTFDTESLKSLLRGMDYANMKALFDEGRKIAFYRAGGYSAESLGEPPTVRIVDLEKSTISDPIALSGVIHGLVALPPDFVRNPDFPYGEASPGIAFDLEELRLFVAHPDGKGLTVMNLLDQTVVEVELGPQPSFWDEALAWLIPPAQAKGGEPSVSMSAWLSPDGSRLLVSGYANDAWRRLETQELVWSQTPLGLTVIDTTTLQVIEVLDLPVSHGVSTEEAIAVAGTTSNLTFCDQVCNPANQEPVTHGRDQPSGLYLLDPTTLEVRHHYQPGTAFHTIEAFEGRLLTETFSDETPHYESIDPVTGATSATEDLTSSRAYIVTGRGILATEQFAYGDTYTNEHGSVWLATDCPAGDVLLSGGADGLPMKGETTREKVESHVGDGGRTSVVPRNGEVWERLADGTIVVTQVDDFMIEVTIDDPNKCPGMPTINNGIPQAYKVIWE